MIFSYTTTLSSLFLFVCFLAKFPTNFTWDLWFSYVFCVLGLVAPWCPTLSDPMDCSPSDSSVHGISQARIMEWVAIFYSWLSSGIYIYIYTISSLFNLDFYVLVLVRKLGMSNNKWPNWKWFKLISKPHLRHTPVAQESSQICYKYRNFSDSGVCALGTQWIETNHKGFSNSGTCALDAQLCLLVTTDSQELIKGS